MTTIYNVVFNNKISFHFVYAQVVVLCCLAAALTNARKITFGKPGDPFAEFKNDHDILVPEDDPNRV